jgi:hypothetical protein
MRNRAREEQRERDLRYGLEHDPREEHAKELELTERIAEQASLPPGHPMVLAAARHRLGGGPSPYEQPHQPEPQSFDAGDRVNHHRPEGPRPGVVVRTLDEDALVEVDFGSSTTFVPFDELERRAA